MNQMLDRYFLLLNNKLDRVREAQSLTLVQYNMIENEQYEELSQSLEKRSKVMEEFEKCSQEIEKLNIADISQADKAKAEEIENAIKDVMSKIRMDNEKQRSSLEALKEECKEEIRQVRENKKGILGYAQYSYSTDSRYFDKKS